MKPLVEEYVKDHSTEEIIRWIADNSRKIHNNTVDDITNKNLDLLCYRMNQLALICYMSEALAKKIGAGKTKVL